MDSNIDVARLDKMANEIMPNERYIQFASTSTHIVIDKTEDGTLHVTMIEHYPGQEPKFKRFVQAVHPRYMPLGFIYWFTNDFATKWEREIALHDNN